MLSLIITLFNGQSPILIIGQVTPGHNCLLDGYSLRISFLGLKLGFKHQKSHILHIQKYKCPKYFRTGHLFEDFYRTRDTRAHIC